MKLPVEQLGKLASIRLRSGVGVFEREGSLHRVEVARTPLGVVRVEESRPELLSVVLDTARAAARAAAGRMPATALPRLKSLARRKPQDAAGPAGEAPKPRVRPMNVGVRPSAVTLHSEVVDESQSEQQAPAASEDRAGKPERRPAKVAEDSMIVAAGKKKVRLTARARTEELQAISALTGLDARDGHRFEPAPWAVWRASSHHAPLRPAQGVHVRYVLGEEGGIALLATAKRPLAWQVLSWNQAAREETLVHAYHLLRIHAVRRLRFDDVSHVSVQGEGVAEAQREGLQAAIGVPVETVPGPRYDGDLVAFGLALGALEPPSDVLNLARSLQPAPSIIQMAPWGEAAFLLSLFLCMYLVMRGHVAGLRQEMRTANQQTDAAQWAKSVHPTKLKQERDALAREVDPFKKFLARELSFGRALGSLAEALPPKVWLLTVTGEDLFWEKNSNKALGERYLLITAGAPSEREGSAPPEINEVVRGLDDDEYLDKVLPRVKLSDVNWRKQAGVGFSVFSLQASPKEQSTKK